MSSQGCTEGLPAAHGDSAKLKKERVKKSPMSCPPQCLDLACVNEIVPITDCRKRRGAGDVAILAHWLVDSLISFFFPLLFEFCLVRFNRQCL